MIKWEYCEPKSKTRMVSKTLETSTGTSATGAVVADMAIGRIEEYKIGKFGEEMGDEIDSVSAAVCRCSMTPNNCTLQPRINMDT